MCPTRFGLISPLSIAIGSIPKTKVIGNRAYTVEAPGHRERLGSDDTKDSEVTSVSPSRGFRDLVVAK